MGDNQLNKVYGRITMDLHGGPPKRPTDRYPTMNDKGGTANQKNERVAILLRHERSEEAVNKAIQHLQDQRRNGHQCVGIANEFHTNSHAPIWYRGSASILITALEMIAATPKSSPLLPTLLVLKDQIFGWWQDQYALCVAARVPGSASIVTTGARYREGGMDEVRNVGIGLLSGEDPSHLGGRTFWRNCLVWQDTFPCELLRRVTLMPGGKELMKSLKPMVGVPTTGRYEVSYYRSGHTTFADQLWRKDPSYVTVRYSDGEVTEGPADGSFGPPLHVVSVGEPRTTSRVAGLLRKLLPL